MEPRLRSNPLPHFTLSIRGIGEVAWLAAGVDIRERDHGIVLFLQQPLDVVFQPVSGWYPAILRDEFQLRHLPG
jgi:hypothetical protein